MRWVVWLALAPMVVEGQTEREVQARLAAWDVAGATAMARALVDQGGEGQARALDLLGASLGLAGDAGALSTLERALALKVGDLGMAETRLLMGEERMARREVAAAREEFQQVVALARGRGEAGSGLLRKGLVGLAGALMTLARLGEAETALKEALGSGDREVWRGLSQLAYLQNKPALAESYLERLKGGEAWGEVDALRTMELAAGLAMERGRIEEASAGLGEVLRGYEARLGRDNRRLVALLRNLARSQGQLSQYGRSIETLERALVIATRAHGEASVTVAGLLGLLATSLGESGQFAEARALFDRALTTSEAALGPQDGQVSVLLFSLANLEQVLGDFESALRHAGRAVAIREAIDGKGSARTVAMYSLLGRVNALNGNVNRGREFSELALELGRKTSGPNHPRTVYAASDLGEILYMAKDYAGARERFLEAQRGQTKIFGEGTIRTAQSEYNLGMAERALGKHGEALERFSAAGRLWSGAFGKDYPLLTETKAGEAASLVSLGQGSAALSPALESARVRREALASVAMTAAEREAMLYARVDRDGLLIAIELAAGGRLDKDGVRAVWDAVIRDRAVVVDTMARRQRLAGSSEGTAGLARQVGQWKRDLARAVLVGDPKLYGSRTAELRERLDGAERKLAAESVRYRGESLRARSGLEEVTAALPKGTALVGYARGEANYVAFVGRVGTGPVAVPLGSVKRIDGLVKAWRGEMERERQSSGRNARKNAEAYQAAGVALRQAIWDPVRRHVGGASAVYTSPDGAIQLVHFDTLPVDTLPGAEGQYLAESGPVWRILSAERDLVRETGPKVVTGGRLLALGDAEFRGVKFTGGCRETKGFERLESAGAEAMTVGKLWQARGGQSEVLRGGLASEAGFKMRVAGMRIVHVATHGFYLAKGCEGGREKVLEGNPLVRSGLVLAGGGGEDGLLTAEEISALPMESAELVVLSGCDTAWGQEEAGEGLLGLRRAFQTAGARQLVSSLWPVEDAATARWMAAFYQARLGRGMATAESVRAASLATLRQRRQEGRSTHPYYWGSFVASGY